MASRPSNEYRLFTAKELKEYESQIIKTSKFRPASSHTKRRKYDQHHDRPSTSPSCDSVYPCHVPLRVLEMAELANGCVGIDLLALGKPSGSIFDPEHWMYDGIRDRFGELLWIPDIRWH